MSDFTQNVFGISVYQMASMTAAYPGQSDAVLDSALASGFRWIDTSSFFRPADSDVPTGLHLVRDALRRHPGAQVALKVGLVHVDGVPLVSAAPSALHDEIRAAVDVLGAPVHTVLLHALDPAIAADETVSALVDARSEGLATKIGVCNVRPSVLESVMALPLDILQYRLSWFDRQALRAGIADQLAGSSCQFSGFDPSTATATGWRSDTNPDLIRRSVEHDCTPRQAELVWVAAQCTGPHVICPTSSADVEDLVIAERLSQVDKP